MFRLPPLDISRPRPALALNPKMFNQHAALRNGSPSTFSGWQTLALVTQAHPSARVQACILDVVGCVTEACLTSKCFAVGLSASVTGAPRESREQRQQRRQMQQEQRQREHALELAPLLALQNSSATANEVSQWSVFCLLFH